MGAEAFSVSGTRVLPNAPTYVGGGILHYIWYYVLGSSGRRVAHLTDAIARGVLHTRALHYVSERTLAEILMRVQRRKDYVEYQQYMLYLMHIRTLGDESRRLQVEMIFNALGEGLPEVVQQYQQHKIVTSAAPSLSEQTTTGDDDLSSKKELKDEWKGFPEPTLFNRLAGRYSYFKHTFRLSRNERVAYLSEAIIQGSLEPYALCYAQPGDLPHIRNFVYGYNRCSQYDKMLGLYFFREYLGVAQGVAHGDRKRCLNGMFIATSRYYEKLSREEMDKSGGVVS